MDKIRLNYTYYNNKKLLEKVVNIYEPFRNWFDFTIIDDGSQINPLTRQDLPDYWKILRVEEDLGWGNEVCRNLLMRNTFNTWNILIDLDVILDLEDEMTVKLFKRVKNTTHFQDYFNNTRMIPLLFQFPHGARVSYTDYTQELDTTKEENQFAINSFLVSREGWSKTYGYDMAFGHVYGSDCTILPSFRYQEFLMPFGKLKKIAEQASPRDFKPKDPEEYKDFFKRRAELTKSGYFDYKSLIWSNESARLKYCIDYPEVVEIK